MENENGGVGGIGESSTLDSRSSHRGSTSGSFPRFSTLPVIGPFIALLR
jgi:hypothetical protein